MASKHSYLVSENAVIQVKVAGGFALHSEYLKVKDFILKLNIEGSKHLLVPPTYALLTPYGFIPFELEKTEQSVYAETRDEVLVNYTIFPHNTKNTLHTYANQKIFNFDTNSPITSLQALTEKQEATDTVPALKCYINTSTSCKGFKIKPAIAYTDSVQPKSDSLFYKIHTNADRIYIDKIEVCADA